MKIPFIVYVDVPEGYEKMAADFRLQQSLGKIAMIAAQEHVDNLAHMHTIYRNVKEN